MSKERGAYIDAIRKFVGKDGHTKEDVRLTNTAKKFYVNLRAGDIHKCVTKAMAVYIRTVLPELSMQQAMELTHTVHTLVQTVLTFLVEDGLIKEA